VCEVGWWWLVKGFCGIWGKDYFLPAGTVWGVFVVEVEGWLLHVWLAGFKSFV
jgi:hypothetical protein